MNIAEKVLQLKQDFADVYAAGKSAGGSSGDYEQGYEDGKNSVVQIDRLVKNCSFPSLNVFGKAEVELNFDNMTGFTNLFQITEKVYANTTVEHLTINCTNNVSSIQQMLYCHSTASDYTLKRVTLNFDTQNCTNFGNAFTCQRALEVIDGQPLNYSAVTNANYMNVFSNCNALVYVRIVPNTIKLSISFANCSNLSTETIQSIIDGLADLSGEEQYIRVDLQTGPSTYAYPEEEVVIEDIVEVHADTDYTMDDGAPVYRVIHGSSWIESYAYKKTSGSGTAQTLTLHSTVGAKLTDEQKAAITAKNWELVY